MATQHPLNQANATSTLPTAFVTPEQTERILARQLARELTKDEIEAISGGMRKIKDVEGTGSNFDGNLDD